MTYILPLISVVAFFKNITVILQNAGYFHSLLEYLISPETLVYFFSLVVTWCHDIRHIQGYNLVSLTQFCFRSVTFMILFPRSCPCQLLTINTAV